MKKSELIFSFILLPLDIFMIVASFVLAYFLRGHLDLSVGFGDISIYQYLKISLYLIPIWIFLFAQSGLYALRASRSLGRDIYHIVIANSVAILLLSLMLFFTKNDFFSRLIVAFTWALSIILVIFGRVLVEQLHRYLLRIGIGQRRVAIVGTGEIAEFVSGEIKKNKNIGRKVVGTISIKNENLKSLKVLGDLSQIESIIEKYNIDEIILSENNLNKKDTQNLFEICADHHIILEFIPTLFGQYPFNIQNEAIGSMPVLALKTTPLDGWGRIIKRILDIIMSLTILIILSPFLVLIIIIQKISSKGPVLYSHARIGRDQKTFKLYKFRSMYQNAENEQNRRWTEKNDSRITPFGKILRKSNLDEIPQLYNILIGDMSLVGPRPEQPEFVEKFSQDVPNYLKRHRIKSGLTGWAQVNGLKGDTSIAERVRYDMFYIENWTLWFDLKIILKTIWILIYEAFNGKYEYRPSS